MLDGARGVQRVFPKTSRERKRTLLSTDAGMFWFGRMARATPPSQRVILAGGLVRRIQGLDAIMPDSCETLSCVWGRVANDSTNAPP